MLPLLLACSAPTAPKQLAETGLGLDSEAPVYCSGAEQVAATPLSPTTEGLAERWDANKELLRILFIGSPT